MFSNGKYLERQTFKCKLLKHVIICLDTEKVIKPAKTIKGLFSWSKLKGDDNLILFRILVQILAFNMYL